MIHDGVFSPPEPFTCIACRTGRCDLCSAPPHVFCECSHGQQTMHETSKTNDTLATSTCYSKDGAMHVGTPTLEQWKAQQAKTADVHHVRWETGGGAYESSVIEDRLEQFGDAWQAARES